MNVIIVEDDIHQAKYLTDSLSRYFPQLKIKASIKDLNKLHRIAWSSIDLLFLDIEVGDQNSINFFEKFEVPAGLDIIITSAHSKYALSSFNIHPFQYLLKPLDVDDLKKVISEWLQKKTQQTSESKIRVNFQDKKILIDTKDILYIKAQGPYSEISTKSQKKYILSKNLKALEAQLPQALVRIHHSYIVNHLEIKSIQDGRFCIMPDGAEIPIAVRKREILKKLGW